MTDTPSEAAIEEALRLENAGNFPDAEAVRRHAAEHCGSSYFGARRVLAHAKTLQEVSDAVEDILPWTVAGKAPSRMQHDSLARFILTKPDPDEELAREIAEQWFVETLHDAAKQAALATIKRLRADGRLTDA